MSDHLEGIFGRGRFGHANCNSIICLCQNLNAVVSEAEQDATEELSGTEEDL
jgi:hypothetical protein